MIENEIRKVEIEAVIHSALEPSKEQKENIKKFLEKKYNSAVILSFKEDKTVQDGFRLEVGKATYNWNLDAVYDWSLKGKFDQFEKELKSINAEENSNIISLLKETIEKFEPQAVAEEVGTVISIGDGVAVVNGLENVAYGEIVVFQSGIKGMVQNINKNNVGCILFGADSEVFEGDKVVRTKKNAGIPVGDEFVGRIINALGEPIDGLGEIKADDYRTVEAAAPSIPQRQSVCQPLETGILAIDSMFPIGKGQRELIIGDRQTGKTSIAIDTILNQKGKDVICIYNAIGQKASSVSKIVNTLKKHDALDYTIIVCSTASEPASLQYIAPYSATALAEYFMYKGKDVLVVYDDLEAYPGDVFYLHSRLLERSSKLSDELGGGSITALPIIETQAGDVSAYIPTNVISITDGQIFLESDLFFAGMRPAVNVGLSVSRVGGAAQTKAMKKAAGSLRIDLAQYREIEVFSQFSSDLDEDTKEQLAYGASLMELLKQPLCSPLSMAKQVISLVIATNKLLIDIPKKHIKEFMSGLYEYFTLNHPDIEAEISTQKALNPELVEKIIETANNYKEEIYND